MTPPIEILSREQIPGAANLVVTRCQDCACATTVCQPRPRGAVDSCITEEVAYRVAPGLRLAPLTDGYWSAFNPEGDAGTVALNDQAYRLITQLGSATALSGLLGSGPAYDSAVRQAFQRLTGLGLLQRLDAQPCVSADHDDVLTAWLHVTNQCNLRCTYCYVEKSAGEMSGDLGRAAIDAVVRSAKAERYRAIRLKYAGGEPLLLAKRVFELHDYAEEACRASSLGLEAVVLTNGTVIDEQTIANLKERSLGIMVSLDGLAGAHDLHRHARNGQGSVDSVIAGIQKLIRGNLRPHLSITITAGNCMSIGQVVEFALAHDLGFSFNLYRESGDPGAAGELAADDERLSAGLDAAFLAIESRLPAWSVVGTVLDRGHLVSPHQHPCGVGSDYMVIDQRGRISRCQMAMGQPVTTLHDPNPLRALRTAPGGVRNPPVTEKEGCRGCEWRFWCTGGCPIYTHRATGRYDLPSPYCRVYKTMYPKAIRLEGLRVLRYACRTGHLEQ